MTVFVPTRRRNKPAMYHVRQLWSFVILRQKCMHSRHAVRAHSESRLRIAVCRAAPIASQTKVIISLCICRSICSTLKTAKIKSLSASAQYALRVSTESFRTNALRHPAMLLHVLRMRTVPPFALPHAGHMLFGQGKALAPALILPNKRSIAGVVSMLM